MAATIRNGLPVWATLLIEFLLVIIAVLLALWAGEWVKAKERRAVATTALENIYHEINGNKHYLEIIHAQHLAYAESFDERFSAMLEIDPLTASQEELTSAGVIPFRGWDAAWRVAQTRGILSDIDYEYAVALTAAYTIQEIYSDFGKEYVGIAFNLDYVDPEKRDLVHESLKSSLATFLSFDQSLLEQYDETLEKIRAHPDINIDDE